MNSLMVRLWNDDCGYILSAESVFLFTITVLGLVTGWVAVRNSVVSELTEVGNAISSLQQGYAFSGLSNGKSATDGSGATDTYATMSPGSTAAIISSINETRCP